MVVVKVRIKINLLLQSQLRRRKMPKFQTQNLKLLDLSILLLSRLSARSLRMLIPAKMVKHQATRLNHQIFHQVKYLLPPLVRYLMLHQVKFQMPLQAKYLRFPWELVHLL